MFILVVSTITHSAFAYIEATETPEIEFSENAEIIPFVVYHPYSAIIMQGILMKKKTVTLYTTILMQTVLMLLRQWGGRITLTAVHL